MEKSTGPGRGEAKAVLIAGPTASGKSALAARLADALGGVIVNADSMQVYRELRILTARPSAEEEAARPHRLYGHVSAAEAYSVARWLADVDGVLAEADQTGRTPIIVGGTGLYFTALVTGLSEVPEIPEAIRSYWRARGRADGGAALHETLRERDPVMAERLRPSDPQRIVRALEVMEATGRSLADWQAEAAPPRLDPARCHKVVLAPDRADLRVRIETRFSQMLEEGAREEVKALDRLDLDPALPAMKAIGVAPLLAHSMGLLSLEGARDRAVADSARYAKRQETWFRNRFADWDRLDPAAIPETADGRWPWALAAS
ncbi:tRNA (adenosine(37)-N6)-dimethylallyltransferase MiaA [Amorphus orientalis]|uniref:tRNA dimethylallyltransferase n=1 Tax=Amorphus orientalis TaxID=649198 RepID=A0AAE3VQZ5_9HYPH|nr:tRNA (adenosine(37)-N6)-dimethylallyltransferase MiaA [Amorphus orientalis]MDQ0316561.1 tRNA dimethylallyltransferase [Amorphus orientalis]